MQVILTHINADFDAVAGLLGTHKIYPSATPVLPKRLNRNVKEFITLYKNGLPFKLWGDFKWRKLPPFEQLILVDTQRIPQLNNVTDDTQITIIDHHKQSTDLPEHTTYIGGEIGAATTLLVEQIRDQHIKLNSLEATLLALGIYEDTGSLTYRATTARDIRAVAWLVEQQADIDVVRRFLRPPLNDAQRDLFEILINTAESRMINGHTITIGSVKIVTYVEQINNVAHRLGDILDPTALFLVVEMPESLQIVCRSKGNVLNVGDVAQHFGGGGHPRASAANVKHGKIHDVVPQLWELIESRIQPERTVADLMSYGVQTVNATDKLVDIITRLRRIGHEGFPVVDNNRVVGLLTRRDADRAIEHNLNNTLVREIMLADEATLYPNSSIASLEKLMVDSGWGQIPIVTADNELIGIVTRTDLIKHWADTHPELETNVDIVESDVIADVLGQDIWTLIDYIANHAQQAHISIYMVGGVVRDLFLERPNYDIDFVVENDAIQFAEALVEQYGGDVNSYRPFGTAKWILNDQIAKRLNVSLENLPDHIDFATSRNEFYQHPTALPTVYNSSIKLDLHRRDFTINTLAIQLSPASLQGRILDFYNGVSDLNRKLIRVLHSLSFVDDPTRILRAVRFEQRLGFEIEPRTLELIDTARPMLRRITGERLRNELTLLLKEDSPAEGLYKLQERHILTSIHPEFKIGDKLADKLDAVRIWYVAKESNHDIILTDLYWHIILSSISIDHIQDVCERLLLGKSTIQSIVDTAYLMYKAETLRNPNTLPSKIVEELASKADIALSITTLIADNPVMIAHIQDYQENLQYIQPTINGNTLKQMALPPGPKYRVILDKLRSARLDGLIQNDNQELDLLKILIREMYDDDITSPDQNS